jgi:hypothetical protein
MPKFVTKFSGLLSASSIAIAILVGVAIGSGLTFVVITMIWGRPDLWPLRVG